MLPPAPQGGPVQTIEMAADNQRSLHNTQCLDFRNARKALSADIIGGRPTLGQNAGRSPGRPMLQQPQNKLTALSQTLSSGSTAWRCWRTTARRGLRTTQVAHVALQGELLPPPLARHRFGAFAKRLEVRCGCCSLCLARADALAWTETILPAERLLSEEDMSYMICTLCCF